jgi:cyclase
MSDRNTLRMFFFTAALMLTAMPSSVRAQAAAPIETHQLAPNVYWIEGGVGSNAGVVIGNDGVIVIDPKQTPESGKAVIAEVAKLTSKPITHVILTHSNSDHVNGLAGFPKGLTIIAQENCKQQMEHPRGNPQNVDLHDYIPNRTVSNKASMNIHGMRFELRHFAPAHTSGDLIVYLPEHKIAFTGDITVARLPYPLIHLEDEGSSAGWVESMKGIAALDATIFVPGHGGTQTKGELQQRLASTSARRNQIKALVAQGKSLDEIKKTLGEPQTPAPGAPNFPTFTEVVYKELSKTKS